MSTVPPRTTAAPGIPPLLRRLVDDAALFPPGSAPMDVAVREHRVHRKAPYAQLVGPFLCPASRWSELVAELTAQPGPALEIGLIGDTGLDQLADAVRLTRSEPHVALRQVECAVPAATMPADLPAAACHVAEVLTAVTAGQGVDCFVEVPRLAGWPAAVRALAGGPVGGRVGAKLRTGGLRADAFPTEAELTEFLAVNLALHQPFKLTAGLHHAVRQTAPDTGFEYHGYLNVLAAVLVGRSGVPAGQIVGRSGTDTLTEVLACRDRAALVDPVRSAIGRHRTGFVSYGSCSVAEPLTDLVELGLLDRALLEHLPPAREGNA